MSTLSCQRWSEWLWGSENHLKTNKVYLLLNLKQNLSKREELIKDTSMLFIHMHTERVLSENRKRAMDSGNTFVGERLTYPNIGWSIASKGCSHKYIMTLQINIKYAHEVYKWLLTRFTLSTIWTLQAASGILSKQLMHVYVLPLRNRTACSLQGEEETWMKSLQPPPPDPPTPWRKYHQDLRPVVGRKYKLKDSGTKKWKQQIKLQKD